MVRTFVLVAAFSASAAAQSDLAPKPYPGLHFEFRFGAPTNTLSVYDLNGQVVNTFTAPTGWTFDNTLAKPLSNGRILALTRRAGTSRLIELDWASNLQWSWTPGPAQLIHHDFQRLADGNTLALLRQRRTLPALGNYPFQDDVLVETDRLGNTVWTWSAASHLAQLPFTQAEWNTLFPIYGTPHLFHANSVRHLPPNRWEATDPRFQAGNVLISFRNLNVVCIVDRTTGNIVWNMRDVTNSQHHATMIPRGLRGAGNILIFDNGGFGGVPALPYRGYSRVIEIDPTTMRVVWQYAERNLFSRFMGSAQRLPNGNTVIGEGWIGRTLEVSPDGLLLWSRQSTQSYRTYRLPLTWPTGQIPAFPW